MSNEGLRNHSLVYLPINVLSLLFSCKGFNWRCLLFFEEIPNKCVVCIRFRGNGIGVFFLDLHPSVISSGAPSFTLKAHGCCVLDHLEGTHFQMWLKSAEDDAKDGESTVFLLASTRALARAGPSVKLRLQLNKAFFTYVKRLHELRSQKVRMHPVASDLVSNLRNPSSVGQLGSFKFTELVIVNK